MPWWKWWAPRCPQVVPAIRGFNLPRMNMAEVGQSKMKLDKRLWLTEAIKVDMVDYAFQTDRYKKFLKNAEKVSGRGPTLKKRTECERAEERRFVDQFCDLIEHGDILEEREDPDELSFMPSSRAKHKAPVHDVGIQEKPKNKKKPVQKQGKKLPDRTGRGQNPRYDADSIPRPSVPRTYNRANEHTQFDDSEDVIVPADIEREFMKTNRVNYIVLKKGFETSEKMITYCRGCQGSITLEDKKFPYNMVFRYKYYRKVPEGPCTGYGMPSPDRRIGRN